MGMELIHGMLCFQIMGVLVEFILRVIPVGFFMFLEDGYKLTVLVIVARVTVIMVYDSVFGID